MFSKVELLIKTKSKDNNSITKHSFDDCDLIFSGNFLILVTNEDKTKTGKIFQLDEISAYKTYEK